jgi:hypothetical protein
MATVKMNNSLVDIAKLTAPFPKELIKVKPGRGRSRYVDAYVVIHRLNESTGYNWEFKVIQTEYRPQWVTMLDGKKKDAMTALVEMTLPGMGSRQHMGVQVMEPGAGEDAAAKGAVTDGLKKVASLFGVGTELYTDGVEDLEDKPTQTTMPTEAPREPATAPVSSYPTNGYSYPPEAPTGVAGFNSAGEFVDAMQAEEKKQVEAATAERPFAPHVLQQRTREKMAKAPADKRTAASDEEKAILRSILERISPDEERRQQLLYFIFGINSADKATRYVVAWFDKWAELGPNGFSPVAMSEASMIWEAIDRAIASNR